LPSSNLHVSPIAYKDNNPIVSIKVKGVTEVELDAYVDSGAGISLIPRSVARKLGLEYVGETPIITGKGKSVLELYRAVIGFHGARAI
jgi:predicted aspartyl protease